MSFMAVAFQFPTQSKSNLWASPPTTTTATATTTNIYTREQPCLPMTDIMSYQYPPPTHHGADLDMQHASYMSGYSNPATSSMEVRNQPAPAQTVHPTAPPQPLPAQDTILPLAHRRDSLSLSKALKLKRSLSTPNVRAQGTNDSDHGHLGLSGEKRRNKLGYHRTSVACGHCRRRKIRCIPQQADIQGRCMNCIRLKKECSFYPVDQQPPPVPGQKPAARSSVGPKIASASSSPAISTGHPSDMSSHQSYPQLATMPSLPSMGPPSIKPSASDAYPADPKMPTSASSSRSFDYNQNVSSWLPTDASPGSAKTPADMNAWGRSYTHESPVTPAFPPYTPQGAPSSATWPAVPLGTPVGSEASSRADEVAWSYPTQPPRSLSYGGEHHQSYPPISQIGTHQSSREYNRKSSLPSDMYPPITTTIPNMESIPGTTIDPHGSLSAEAVPPSNYGTWQHPYSYAKSSEGYGGWYDSAGHSEAQVSASGDSASLYYGGR